MIRRRRVSTSVHALLLASLALGVAARPAGAQAPSDAAASDSLYDDARRLMIEGHHSEACPKLVEAHRLAPGVGILLMLGQCYELTNRIASAWSTYREAASLAHSRSQSDRERIAHENVTRVAPKVSMLTIEVTAPVPSGFEVRRDDGLVGRDAWGVAIAVDPGRHQLSAAALGYGPWKGSVDVVGEAAHVTARIPALVALPPPAPSATPAPAPPPTASEITRPPAPPRTQTYVGVGAAGVGVAAVAVGVILGVAARAKAKDAQDHCSPSCSQDSGTALYATAENEARAANVLFATGGGLAALGLVLVLTSPSATTTGALRVVPALGAGQAGGMLTGAF